MIFDIVTGSNSGRAKVISASEIINLYPEYENGEESKSIKALVRCPGYRQVIQAYSSGVGRNVFGTSNDKFFTVVGNKLVEMTTAEAVTIRGTLNTSIGRCIFSDNGTQLLITDGTYGYIYNMSTEAFAVISDEHFPSGPTHNIFTDGYFLVNEASTGKFYFSNSYDGTAWEALDFATAEYSSDTLQGIEKTSNGTIWMIGKQNVELWQNVGTSDLPWRRIDGAVKEVGTIAKYSIASNGTQVFWLGNGKSGYGSVFMGYGYEIQKVSTPSIEAVIKGITNISDAVGFVYDDEGHSFYVLSFSSEKTIVYDITTGKWHYRGTYNNFSGGNVRQFSNSCAFFNKKYYIGSYNDGYVYEMSLSIYGENGNAIQRRITTNSINSENKLLKHRKIEIECEKGIGLNGGDNPRIILEFSDDDGKTWSNYYYLTVGKIGEYKARAVRYRLGSSRNRVYRLTMSELVPWTITRAFIEVE